MHVFKRESWGNQKLITAKELALKFLMHLEYEAFAIAGDEKM